MTEPGRRESTLLDRVLLVVGLLLTVVLFSGFRPWGPGLFNAGLLLGPILLVAMAASQSARSTTSTKPGQTSTPAGRVFGTGVVMLLIGGCPWLYTPLLTGGENNQASGMIGTMIFLLIGLPGLAVTLIGLINLVAQRRARQLVVPPSDLDTPD